jgi:anti-anti-sigma factor
MSEARDHLPFDVEADAGRPGRFVLRGELDLTGVPLLEHAVEAAGPGSDVILDLAELVFLDSSGINAFIRLARAAEPGRLILQDPVFEVRRVLDLVGLDSLANLEIRPGGSAP